MRQPAEPLRLVLRTQPQSGGLRPPSGLDQRKGLPANVAEERLPPCQATEVGEVAGKTNRTTKPNEKRTPTATPAVRIPARNLSGSIQFPVGVGCGAGPRRGGTGGRSGRR